MYRLAILFAFVTTVLLTSAIADPTAPVVEPAATQEAVATDAQPTTAAIAPTNDSPAAEPVVATSPETAAEAPAVPADTK